MLISVIVLTYNSSKYIVECLDSIYSQTHKEIELIISDDCSKDDTISIVENWSEEHQDLPVKIVKTAINTGTSANCNRGLSASSGEFVKFIAGDDLLDKCCIENVVKFVSDSKPACFVATVKRFSEVIDESSEIKSFFTKFFYDKRTTAFNQHKMLVEKNIVPAPGLFFNRSVLVGLGGFDERFKLLEDAPMLKKITGAGYKIEHLSGPVVYYRQHNESWTMNKGASSSKYNTLSEYLSVSLEQASFRIKLLWKIKLALLKNGHYAIFKAFSVFQYAGLLWVMTKCTIVNFFKRENGKIN